MVGLGASQLLGGQRKLLGGLDPNFVGLQLAIPVVGIPSFSSILDGSDLLWTGRG